MNSPRNSGNLTGFTTVQVPFIQELMKFVKIFYYKEDLQVQQIQSKKGWTLGNRSSKHHTAAVNTTPQQ